MSTYSAGYLNVSGGLNATGTSATLVSTTANVTNLSATTVNVTNLNSGNLDLSGNLTVAKDVTFRGLNFTQGLYEAGDVISYNLMATMTAAQSTSYFANITTLSAASATGITPLLSALYGLNVYELVYWGYSAESSDTKRMSATLLIPQTAPRSNKTIVSYKHATISSDYQNNTLWYLMKDVDTSGSLSGATGVGPGLTGVPNARWNSNFNPLFVDIGGWYISALSGYICVVADNPSFGVSVGTFNYLDQFSESISQANAVQATQRLLTMHPELVVGGVASLPLNVVSSGFSVGGMNAGSTSYMLDKDPKLNVINTIAGAPVNPTGVVQQLFSTINRNNPVLWQFGFFFLYHAIANPYILQYVQPWIYNDVLPAFNQNRLLNPAYFTPTSANTYFFQEFIDLCAVSMTTAVNSGLYPDLSGHYPSAGNNPSNGTFYMDTMFKFPDVFAVNNSYLANTFYTDPFINYRDLSGVPVHTIYTIYDEICIFDTSKNYPDSSSTAFIDSKDRVYDYFTVWVDSSSQVFDSSGTRVPPPKYPLNGTMSNLPNNDNFLINYSDPSGYTNEPNFRLLVDKIKDSETTRVSSITRINPVGKTGGPGLTNQINHGRSIYMVNLPLVQYLVERTLP